MILRDVLALTGLTFLTGCGSGCSGDPLPASDTCEATGGVIGTVDAISIGRYSGGAFTELQDGDVLPVVVGGQGSDMFVLNLRLQGSNIPACLPQATRVRNAYGETVASEELPLTTEQVLPDTWITGDMLLPTWACCGEWVTVYAEAGGTTAEVGGWVEYEGTALPDAAVVVDAMSTDAGTPDAAPPDAAPMN